MQNRPSSIGPGPLLEDQSAGDPASLGIAVLLASLSSTAKSERIKDVSWSDAATSQINFLSGGTVPRNETTGAISHRVKYSQAWGESCMNASSHSLFVYEAYVRHLPPLADSVSMVPPFMAYYALVNEKSEYLQAAYDQCASYRQTLQQNTTKLWRHMEINTIENNIANDEGEIIDQTAKPDISLWATGNAWAASGMLRVYATILQSPYNEEMSKECDNLKLWVQEIIAGTTVWTASSGLVHNNMLDSSTFEDTAASTLLAATMYRLAALDITPAYVPYANKIYSTIAEKYINETGYLTGAVDPLKFNVMGTESPEGQAFVLMMHAAYRDYTATREKSAEDSGFYSEASRYQGPPPIDTGVGGT